MVVVRVTEMYDLRTVKDKIGLIGIHTPSGDTIYKRWKGLFINHKFMRVLGCDVKIACASVQPADPLQVGTDADQIAPQDLMNPILYRNVTNEGWNAVISRLYATSGITAETNSITYREDAFGSVTGDDQEKLYYGLLSTDEWKKSMPQQGLSIRGVRPLVYNVVSSYGDINGPEYYGPTTVENSLKQVDASNASGAAQTLTAGSSYAPAVFRGHAVPMPRMPCTTASYTSYTPETEDTNAVLWTPNSPPRTFVSAIVMPPAKLVSFYFRMLVSWDIEFSGLCTQQEKLYAADQIRDVNSWYYRRYTFSSAKDIADAASEGDLTQTENSVDSLNAPVELVMEK